MSARDFPFSFHGGDARLSGLMRLPASGEPRGVVYLLSGSGPQDRDQTIAGHRPFKRLAHALADEGFATVRWDDRGVGESGGDYQAVDADRLVEDVGSAMSVAENALGDCKNILLGHSQGTLIGTRFAARNTARVSALVLLAPMLVDGRQGLLQQHEAICRAEGWDEASLSESLLFKERAFDLLDTAQQALDSGADAETTLAGLSVSLRLWASNGHAWNALTSEQKEEVEFAVEDLLEWEWRFLLRVKPAEELAQVRCPVLAVFGGSDTQVDCAANRKVWQDVMSRRTNAHAEVLENHNHLFQNSPSGRLSEYTMNEKAMSPLLLSTLRGWLARQAASM